MIHRHLDYAPDTPVERLGRAAIDDLLDRGDLDDWAALTAAIRAEPWGEIANTVLQLCRDHRMYGTSTLWPAFVAASRAACLGVSAASWPRVLRRLSLGDLRRRHGRSQAEVGNVLNMNQSEVSKLEARADVRVGTLSRYVKAIGGDLRLVVADPAAADVELELARLPVTKRVPPPI